MFKTAPFSRSVVVPKTSSCAPRSPPSGCTWLPALTLRVWLPIESVPIVWRSQGPSVRRSVTKALSALTVVLRPKPSELLSASSTVPPFSVRAPLPRAVADRVARTRPALRIRPPV